MERERKETTREIEREKERARRWLMAMKEKRSEGDNRAGG